jgi:hypothetical protein
MGIILLALAVIAGAGALVFAAHRLGLAYSRIDLLRHQRRRDSKLQR